MRPGGPVLLVWLAGAADPAAPGRPAAF